jgi:hypothetical protein
VVGEGDERKGVCVAHRIGYQEPDRKEFSVKDAKRANLWAKAGPWQEYPDGQLEWRAVGIMGKRVFSDVLGGFPIDVEAGDYTVLELTRTPEGTKPPELPQPSTPDPLFDAIAKAGVAPAPSEEKIIDAEVVTVTDATVAEVKVFETEASPPYPQKWYREERCEHGTVTGDFCRECSVEMDGGEAQQEQTNERDDAPGLFEIPGQSKRKRR